MNTQYNAYNPYLSYPTYLPQQATYGQTPAQLPTIPSYSQIHPNQPMPSQQSAILFGRVVKNEEEITPNEVSMDGSISIFPLSDYSCIIAKQWNSDGTIKTLKFIQDKADKNEEIEQPTDIFNDLTQHIDSRLDKIEKMMSSRTNSRNTGNKTYSKTKTTDGDENE